MDLVWKVSNKGYRVLSHCKSGITWLALCVFSKCVQVDSLAQDLAINSSPTQISSMAAENSSDVLCALALSTNPKTREAAFSALWTKGRDGELAVAIVYAINFDLAPDHFQWLVSQIQYEHLHAKWFLEMLADHESLQVRTDVFEARVRTCRPENKVRLILKHLDQARSRSDKNAAIMMLGRLGSSAREAEPRILEMIPTEEDSITKLLLLWTVCMVAPSQKNADRYLREGVEAAVLKSLGDFDAIVKELKAIHKEQDLLLHRTQQEKKRSLLELLDR